MNLLHNKHIVVGVGIALLTVASVQAQYSADARTVATFTADPTAGIITNRLFLDQVGTLAPINSLIWFVADTGGNDLNHNLTPQDVINIRDGIGDDRLIAAAVVDGSLPLAQAGKFSQVISNVPASYGNVSIHVLLWNTTGIATTPGAGVTWGEVDLGIRTPPAFGNANWQIDQSIFANSFVVVPEPSTYALMGLGALGLLSYRRFRK